MSKSKSPIALFGTSADPPTCGHEALLVGLLNLFPKVITWASDNPIKSHGANIQKRAALLNALVKTIANPNLELIQELSSPWTITSLERAVALWPGSELVFVIGSDLTCQIPNWKNSQSVLKIARLGIAPRAGWPLQAPQIKLLESLGAQIEILPLEIPATASSNVRKTLELSHIPNAVLSLLLEEKLYGLTQETS